MTECLLEFQASERNQAFIWKSLVSKSFVWRQKRDDAAKNDNIKTGETGQEGTKKVALVSDTERKYIERPTHWSSVALQALHKSHLSLICSPRT